MRIRTQRPLWRKKYALVRAYGVRLRDQPLNVTRFVLIDPEMVNFTYEDLECGRTRGLCCSGPIG